MDGGEQCRKAREDGRWGQAQGWPCAEGGGRVLGPRGVPFPDGETEAQRGAGEVNRPEPCPSHTQTFLNRNIG